MSTDTRFERVVLPHLDAAYTLARYLTRDVTDAEDAVQEAILRAVRYFHTLRSDGEARTWLLAIVRRECYGGRRKHIDAVAFDDTPELQLVDPGALPDQVVERGMMGDRIRAAVAALPEALREVVILREIQQFSYEEIATITEVPAGTVMSRLSRARARLAVSLRGTVDLEEEYG